MSRPIAIPVVDKVRTLVTDLAIPSLHPEATAPDITGALEQARTGGLEHLEPTLRTRRTAIGRHLDVAANMWMSETFHTPDLSEAK